MGNGNKMLKDNFVYMGAAVLSQGISVLLVPVFTKNMSTDDFGLYNLLISVQMLLTILATLGIASGLTRFFNEFEDKNKLKNTALTFELITGLLLTLLMIVFGENIFTAIFGTSAEGGHMLVIVMVSTVFLSINTLYLVYYNMYEKAMINGIINVSRSILLLSVSIVLIIFLNMGLMGALLAQLIAYGTVAVVVMCADIRGIRLQVSPQMLKPMLKYGTGLMPGQVSGWVYTLIDRYFLKAMVSLTSVGIYSMGFKLGSLFEPLFLMPFKAVFQAYKYKEYRNEGAREKIRQMFKIYASVAWFIAFSLSVFAKPGILLLSTPDYLGAVTVVPLVAAAYVINGFDEFFAMGLHIRNMSFAASVIFVATAGLNIVLNIVLIPLAGMHGAALATILSAIAMDMTCYWAGKKYYNLGIRYFEGFKPLPAVIAAYALYYWACCFTLGLIENLLISTIACCCFLFAAYWTGVIPREIYHSICHTVESRFNKGGQSDALHAARRDFDD